MMMPTMTMIMMSFMIMMMMIDYGNEDDDCNLAGLLTPCPLYDVIKTKVKYELLTFKRIIAYKIHS